MRALIRSALVLTLFLAATQLAAQQAAEFDRYEVHYNALNTNMLTPEVASAYGIQRSGTQAMLNLTVLDRETGEPVAARTRVSATNLTGQRREIELRQINDQGAIYHIGQFRIHDEETLNFVIDVVPEGHQGAPLNFSFRQQFFTG